MCHHLVLPRDTAWVGWNVWTSPNQDELKRQYPQYEPKLACGLPADNALYNGSVRTNARGYSTFVNEKDPELDTSWQTELSMFDRCCDLRVVSTGDRAVGSSGALNVLMRVSVFVLR